jgi:hypothetical protein
LLAQGNIGAQGLADVSIQGGLLGTDGLDQDQQKDEDAGDSLHGWMGFSFPEAKMVHPAFPYRPISLNRVFACMSGCGMAFNRPVQKSRDEGLRATRFPKSGSSDVRKGRMDGYLPTAKGLGHRQIFSEAVSPFRGGLRVAFVLYYFKDKMSYSLVAFYP